MGYDLFISYSRRDNLQGRVTQLVRRVEADFKVFSGRQLEPFFDVLSIRGMEDWRNRILQGLRESRLLLACLSPAYVASEHCEWEFTEYLKHEVGRLCVGEGVAPIYFIEVPGWEDRGFEQHCVASARVPEPKISRGGVRKPARSGHVGCGEPMVWGQEWRPTQPESRASMLWE